MSAALLYNIPAFATAVGALSVGHNLYYKCVKPGVLKTGRRLAKVSVGLNNIDGITSVAKMTIAWAQFYALFGRNQLVGTLPYLKPLKEMVYAVGFLKSAQPFISQSGHLQLPILPKNNTLLNKILATCTLLADLGEFFTYLHKYQVCQVFAPVAQLAHRMGNAKVFPGLNGQKLSMKDMPWLCLFDQRIKDFIMFPVCLFGAYSTLKDCHYKPNSIAIKELAGYVGKAGLIVLARYWATANDWKLVAFHLLDIFTQTVGFCKTVEKMDLSKIKI